MDRPIYTLDWERMVEAAFAAGILPRQMYDMELWEFNACVRAHNLKVRQESERALRMAWQTAAFTGAAFGGKLKAFEKYVPSDRDDGVSAGALTRNEMDEFDKRFEKRRGVMD